ncbi:MAG: isochorismatase family protein, partial [Nanoarchaeota archaeon]|nr:isochorismatase family protein [Nanoarchaeota archaeon]
MKKINLNETALLIIHFQNDFCHKNALESKGKNADVVAKNINNLVDFFDGKIQIIFSKARYDKKYLSEFQVIDGLDELEYPCREGTWGAEYFKLKLPKNYVEINSSRNDSFAKTFLEKILKSKKIKN